MYESGELPKKCRSANASPYDNSGRRGFCNNSYFYNFLFAFRVSKFSNLKKKPGLTDPTTIVYRLM